MYRFFLLVNALSLDVVAGAVVCSLFLSNQFNVHSTPRSFIALGITVWLIYSADRLLDVHGMQHKASTFRHRFFQKHFSSLVFIEVCVAMVGAVLLFFLPRSVILSGMFLLLFVVVYLLFLKRYPYMKEIAGILLFVVGVMTPIMSSEILILTWQQSVVLLQFLLTVALNIFLFSLYEGFTDIRDHQSTIIQLTGKKKLKFIILVTMLLQGILFLLSIGWNAAYSIWPLLIMNAVLVFLFLVPGIAMKRHRYRIFGDLVFLIPALTL